MTDNVDNSTGEARPDDGQHPPMQKKKHNAAGKPRQQHSGQQRAVNPLLERLFELYPALFGAQFLPLKLGVFHDLLARHPDDFKKEELKLAMGQHARSTRYLESVAAGYQRHDLDGNQVEPVAPEHVHHAILEIFRRRQLRSREDLKPQLVQRLVAAIDASGLSPEAYQERVHVQDEATNALTHEAHSEIRLLAAKREALARAFTASGKTVAEFADMYGIEPVEVERALEAVKTPAA